jgi:hypothetical protein
MWMGILVGVLVASAPVGADTPDPRVVSVLQYWETTSQASTRAGLVVRTLQPSLGPLREDSLRQRFTWTLSGDSELMAVPTDPAERQFSPQVRIAIDADGLPQSVAIGQLRLAVRDLVRAKIVQRSSRESISPASDIVRVSFNPDEEASLAAPVDSRVRQVISRWVAASRSTPAVRARFQRMDYDSAIEVETHATGEFVFCAPDQGLYQSLSSPPSGDSAGTRIGLNGRPYVRLAGENMMLVWNGKDLTQVYSSAQSYEVFERPGTPHEVLGAGSFDAVWQTLITPQSALPMVVGLVEKELLTNYAWELVADDPCSLILRGTPVNGPDASLYSSVQVVIDPACYRTQATRIIDIAGSKETMHQFTYRVISKDPAALGEWFPDLSHFRRVGDVPGAEASSSVEDDQTVPPPPSE